MSTVSSKAERLLSPSILLSFKLRQCPPFTSVVCVCVRVNVAVPECVCVCVRAPFVCVCVVRSVPVCVCECVCSAYAGEWVAAVCGRGRGPRGGQVSH